MRSVLLAALRGFLRGGLRDVYVQAVRQLFASEDWSMYVDAWVSSLAVFVGGLPWAC